MIVVDTSIWVEHFRNPSKPFAALIAEGGIALHPYVLGELALGGFPTNGLAADELAELPAAPISSASEVLAFIGWAELARTGLGYVDAHLLVSARLSRGRVWTNDQKLSQQASRFGLAYTP